MNIELLPLYIIMAANVLFSMNGFNNKLFFSDNAFTVSGILGQKQYKRLFTSGFLHVGWGHLLFNMFALYSFGQLLLQLVGSVYFIAIYFVSLLGGNLLSLYINRNKSYYSAVGASGAVSGVIFACIALYPDIGIGFIFIPFIDIPGWIFGPAFILISIYGMQRQSDNIGHEAHLGGAIVGMLLTVALYPWVLSQHPLVLGGMLLPTIGFMIYLAKKPPISPWLKKAQYQTQDDIFKSRQAEKQNRLNQLLDKANRDGWEKLTQEELNELDKLANSK